MALTLGGFIAVGSFMAPLYLQTVRNEIPYVAGLMLLPISGAGRDHTAGDRQARRHAGPDAVPRRGPGFLAIAALVQIFFEPASPVWLVLVGLGLFGFGWGLQQATSALAATVAPPAGRGGPGHRRALFDLECRIERRPGGGRPDLRGARRASA